MTHRMVLSSDRDERNCPVQQKLQVLLGESIASPSKAHVDSKHGYTLKATYNLFGQM